MNEMNSWLDQRSEIKISSPWADGRRVVAVMDGNIGDRSSMKR